MRALVFAFGLIAMLGACGTSVIAPPEQVARAAYRHEGPATLTLYSVIRTADGSGGHTALMINGAQRVLFDPAGSFALPAAPEVNDLLYGITPQVLNVYIDYHARETFSVHEHEIVVSRAVADQAIALAQKAGPVGPARCTASTMTILRALPGLSSLPSTPFPARAMRAFALLPGVKERIITDDDADDNHGVLIRARQTLGAAQ